MSNYNTTETPTVGPGNYTTVNDAYDTTKHNNGAKMEPGQGFWIKTSAGYIIKLRYVRYNPTAAVTLTANTNVPGGVFWKDAARTTVTPTMSEGISTKANGVAGYLLNASVTAGNWTVIQTHGYLSNAVVAASTAIDDTMIGLGATPLIMGRVAAGTAPTSLPLAIALAAISGAQAPVWVCIESR